jgi:hypothetical protein
MFFNLLFIQYVTHLLGQVQALTQSFWGWVVLIVALIAALDAVLVFVFLLVRNRPCPDTGKREISKERDVTLKIIHNREACDLKVALEKLQEDHIAALLRSIPLRDSDIPGIWPLVKTRLISNGIHTALDARIDRLLPMRWLGEVPLRALLAWRSSQEAAARQTMPRRLPPEQAAQIRARYEALRRELAGEGI